jgi:hypothetical protein
MRHPAPASPITAGELSSRSADDSALGHGIHGILRGLKSQTTRRRGHPRQVALSIQCKEVIMRKLCSILALAVLTPFAWVTAQDDQGPVEKATNTTKKAAEDTGQTIKHGAQATGSAISRGTKATERTVGKTLERTGSKIRAAGATPTQHRITHRTATAKKSPTAERSPSPGASPETNPANRPSPTPNPEANPSATPVTSPSPATTPQ